MWLRRCKGEHEKVWVLLPSEVRTIKANRMISPLVVWIRMIGSQGASSKSLLCLKMLQQFSLSTSEILKLYLSLGSPRELVKLWIAGPATELLIQSFWDEEWVSEWSRSVVCDSLRPRGPARLLRPWDSPGENTGVGCHFLLQGIFLTQGSNPDLLHCRQTL